MFKKDFSCVWLVLACLSLVSLTACSDDAVGNPRSLAEPGLPTDASGDGLALSSQSDSLVSVAIPYAGGVMTVDFPVCNTESEGRVEKLFLGGDKYGYDRFYKCEQGSWNETDISATCDTAGVSVGAICKRDRKNGFFYSNGAYSYSSYVFIYAGNGVWEDFDGLAKMTKECTAENEGDKEKLVYGSDDNTLAVYYKCSENKWTEIDEPTFYCAEDSASVGGTCSVEIDGKMAYYKYENRGWVKSGYDPELGFCPVIYKTYFVSCGEGSEFDCKVDEYNQPKLRESGWVNYYCRAGQWKQSNIVPNQYTDPRKEGLTDMEYDVLDLPKEAKVGDRVGGLLETCWYDVELYTIAGWGVYDYCLSRNYYRYRENGSWTLETRSEFEDYLSSDHLGCNAETEGEKRYSLPRNDEPGAVYQCVSGYAEPVEYIFNHYEKK
ncbi:hypothetical protein B7990_12845 [Fibrobacter sp. UWB4]|uniref:hypothetical protein n=1 Tax=Fibrobacter sp. UWB4 TaxID=1964356 RepID=UPI000B51F221|nr:hypothetical protein [Fibrobacter sp. UWB4]OWV16114.1 hypothetical protein B7990_12845 [Fibrobacter sp. UWB4]